MTRRTDPIDFLLDMIKIIIISIIGYILIRALISII
jgi:hypothetical protein